MNIIYEKMLGTYATETQARHIIKLLNEAGYKCKYGSNGNLIGIPEDVWNYYLAEVFFRANKEIKLLKALVISRGKFINLLWAEAHKHGWSSLLLGEMGKFCRSQHIDRKINNKVDVMEKCDAKEDK